MLYGLWLHRGFDRHDEHLRPGTQLRRRHLSSQRVSKFVLRRLRVSCWLFVQRQ